MTIAKRMLTTVAALGVAAGAIGATASAASAAVNLNLSFGVPGIYSSPPPNPSCWRWSHVRGQWVWTCSTPHPTVTFDMTHHRWRTNH